MRRKVFGLVGVAAVAAACWVVPEAVAQGQARSLLNSAKEHLAAREFDQAREALEQVRASHAGDPEGEEARWLIARAYLLDGQHTAAIDAADALLAATPGTRFGAQAVYLKAECYLALGAAPRAAELLEGRMLTLSGPEHQRDLAQAYLDLADEAYDPPADDQQPNLRRALENYQRARRTDDGLEAGRVVFRIAECQRGLGQLQQAVASYRSLRELAPEHEHAAESLRREGEVLLQLGRRDEGRGALRQVEAEHPGSGEAALAVEALADSYSPLNTGSEEARRLGIETYQRFLEVYGGHARAPEVLLKLAQSHAAGGALAEAIAAYRRYVERFPDAEQVGEARFQVGVSFVGMHRFDQAREAFGVFLGRHPSHPRFVDAQERIATSWITQGEVAQREQRPDDATRAWNSFLGAYPVHARAAEVQRRLGEHLLAQGDAEGALAAWRAVSERYRGQREGARAHMLLARLFQDERGDLTRATEEYEALIARFPRTPEAQQARQILAQLKETYLRVLTPRARTVAEGPVLSLATRNVEALEFKAYGIDLAEYFARKRHLGQVEDLAIDIVKPDQTWTYEVPDYEDYRLFDREVALPLEGAGAWVVVAEQDEYRATTLVVVSDLSMIVKRAPGQVLVLVEDETTGGPAAGVAVQVTNARAELARGTTGEDGVVILEDDALGASREARVFVQRGESVGYDAGNAGSRGAFGYSPKCFVFTERPVYRPGASVQYKAFVRGIEDGGYVTDAGAEVQVQVVDARGITRENSLVRLSRFGSLDGQLELGEDAPMGAYTVIVRHRGVTGTAQFNVEAYRKPEVMVELDPAARQVLTGEDVTVEAHVRTYYGGTVSEAPLEWTLTRTRAPFDATVHEGFAWFHQAQQVESTPAMEVLERGTARADAEGNYTFRFGTEALDYDARYTLSVVSRGLDNRPVSSATSVFATVRGFYAIVKAESRVVQPGAAFRALIETVGPDHRGVPAEGSLQIVRRTETGEAVVSERAVRTDEAGQASVSGLRIDRPGDYQLRFVSSDARGGRVQGQDSLVVEGTTEDLAREAKVRADREVYRRGDTARVLLNAPAEGTLALFTCEGERILSYRVLRLTERSTTLELTLEDQHAPNAFLNLALNHEGEFYSAEDQVLVFKYLDLEVRTDKEVYGPGEEVTLEVIARDQGGNPVEAEVAVGVVDEAIYAIRPDLTPGLKPFFYDQRRQNAVTTGSSVRWSYAGVTREQLKELLAEREQRELEEQMLQLEEARRQELSSNFGGGGGGRSAARRSRADFAPAPAQPMEPEPEAMADGLFAGEGAEDDLDAAQAPGGAGPATRRNFADTAVWAPRVITGADGVGRVRFRLPDDLTTWRITARGASAQTLVGDALGSLRTTKDLVVRLALPAVVTERDTYRGGLIVDNRTGRAIEGLGRVGVDARPGAPQSFSLEPGRATRLDVPGPVGAVGERRVRGEATAGTHGDALERTVRVVPVGRPVVDGRSGRGDQVWTFELPEQAIAGTESLDVIVYTQTSTKIHLGLDALERYPYGCVEQTVSRFLPLVWAQELLRASGLPEDALRARLTAGIERGVRRLIDLQNSDGGWGWWGGQQSRPQLTAYALLGLGVAAEQGTFVDPQVIQRAIYASQRFLRAVGDDHDTRALLCFALARLDQARGLSDDLNRVERNAGLLSTEALAQLILLRHATGGAFSGLVDTLRGRIEAMDAGASCPAPERVGPGDWFGSRLENSAWAGLALQAVAPNDPRVAELAAWIQAQQSLGGMWRSTKETAAALMFLARHEQGRVRRVRATSRVEVAGGPASERESSDATRPHWHRLTENLPVGRFQVSVSCAGVDQPRVTARLSYTLRTESLEAEGVDLVVARDLLPWSAEGRTRAFSGHASIVRRAPGEVSEAVQPIEALAVGERAWLRVRVTAREAMNYGLAEVPLPGGVEVVRGELQGSCDRLEVRDDRLALFFSDLPAGTREVRVLVQAVTVGRFTLLPAAAELMYEPEVRGLSAGSTLLIEAERREASEPTPDERLIEVRTLLRQEKWAEAQAILVELAALDLIVDAEREVLGALFRVALEQGDQPLVVEAYERWRDAAPREANRLTLEARQGLALAYRATGEHARAAVLAKQVLVELFRAEAELWTVYRDLGRPLVAQEVLVGALLRFPPEQAVIEGWFNWAQAYFTLPRPRGEDAPPRPRHWQGDRVADTMLEEAYMGMKDFCAWFPNHASAPRAHGRAVEALVQLRIHELVAAEAFAFARRYPADAGVDDVLIQRLRALTALERWDDAFTCGQRILDYRERRGRREIASPFNDEVRHTFARIHHQRGEIAQAVAFYAQVKDRIPDARDAHTYFTEAGLEVPEIVSSAPGEAPALPVRFKNLERFELAVYPVDFMILFLTRKNLAGIHDIDLTGIAPRLEREVALGSTTDYAWGSTTVDLPIDEHGVYLVVGKSGSRQTSTIVVVSELDLEVQRSSARVRAYVTTRDGQPAAGVRVRVTDGRNLVARGETDARGVFEGEARVRAGDLSVVVERDGHYALFRE